MLTLLSALSRHSCRLGRGPCPSTHTSATPTRGEGTRSGSGGGGAVAGLAARGKWQAPPLPSPRRGASPRAARLLTGEAEGTRSPRPSPPAARRRQPRQAARSPLGQHKRGRGCRAHSRCPRARRVKRPRFSGPAIWRGPAQPSQQGSRGRRDGAAVAVPVRRPLELQHASHAILRDEELAYCSQLWLRRSSRPRSNRDTNLHLGRPRRISVDLARDALCAASGAPRGPKARQVGQLPGRGFEVGSMGSG